MTSPVEPFLYPVRCVDRVGELANADNDWR